MTPPRMLRTRGYVGSSPVASRHSAAAAWPAGESGAWVALGMPIRAKNSRVATASASPGSAITSAVVTSGAATVEPQSDRSSHTAVWNSSSR